MEQFEGLWYWFSFMLGILFLTLLPTLIGAVGVIVRSILYKKHRKLYRKYDKEIDTLVSQIVNDEQENLKEIREKIEEVKAKRSHEKYMYYKYDEQSYFNTLLLGSLDDTVLGFLTALIGWIIKFAAFVAFVFTIVLPFSMKSDYKEDLNHYENIKTIIAEKEAVEHPTRKYIVEQEEWNDSWKFRRYLSDEFENDPNNYVDTEMLWARFCDNVDSRRTVEAVK